MQEFFCTTLYLSRKTIQTIGSNNSQRILHNITHVLHSFQGKKRLKSTPHLSATRIRSTSFYPLLVGDFILSGISRQRNGHPLQTFAQHRLYIRKI